MKLEFLILLEFFYVKYKAPADIIFDVFHKNFYLEELCPFRNHWTNLING